MRKQIFAAIRIFLALTILVGVIYPLAILGISQLTFKKQANGSYVKVNGKIVGSSLIGQNFDASKWFHPRPSAAGTGYDALLSGGSNLGPTNPDFIKLVEQRSDAYRKENMLSKNVQVPQDAVTASASGLDPDISVLNANLQAKRVAKARNLDVNQVLKLINENKVKDSFDFGLASRINVLNLNIALEKLTK